MTVTQTLRARLPAVETVPQGDGTWEARIDGAFVANDLDTEEMALAAAEAAAFHAVFGEVVPDPGPNLLTDEAFDLALAILELFFTTALVAKRLQTARAAIVGDADTYFTQPDGTFVVLGSKSYSIKAPAAPAVYAVQGFCPCADSRQRHWQTGGVCKHVAAKLLVAVAQQGVDRLKQIHATLSSPAPEMSSEPTLPLATLVDRADVHAEDTGYGGATVPALVLASACALIGCTDAARVQIVVSHDALTFATGDLLARIPAPGSAPGSLVVPTDRFNELLAALTPVARQLRTAPVDVIICGGQLIVSQQATGDDDTHVELTIAGIAASDPAQEA